MLDCRTHMLRCGFGAHGKRQHFLADADGLRQPRIAQTETRVFPHRLRPMNQSFDSRDRQMFSQPVALLCADDVVLEYVELTLLSEVRKREIANSLETFAIESSDAAAMLDPLRKVPQLDVKYRRLDVVQQGGVAVIMILSGFPIL